MELVRLTSHGGFSARRIFMFAMTVLVTALLTAISFSPLLHAQGPEASWKGASILYDGRQYFPGADAKDGDSHGLPAGTKIYISTSDSDAQNGSTRDGLNTGNATTKAFFLFFAPGTDPPTATSVQHTSYDVDQTGTYSNRQSTATVTLTPESETNQYSACTVEGIGWIICPVTVFLAGGMDWLFSVISGFVAVQPLTVNDPNGPLHTAWNVMRSFANVAFIILFLIIIYSQVTGWGISNYGLKRLLPRMIIAAILVNLSFYITAIAVDLSNVLGYGLQDTLIAIRETTFTITNETYSDETTTWANIAGAILSGGAATYGIIALSTATAGSIGAAVYFIVPLLVGLVLTAVFVLLILAARQAIIIILIVISPLAFVANLLPNTEKWFDKWRDLFMTMLIFFPAFSLVFGGSQLAGGIIIQNASGPFGLVMMIFGMAVQVAPLIITPLILKLSGSLLGRLAQIVNDPRKGMLDRTKNWANERGTLARNRSLQRPTGKNLMRDVAQRMDRNRRYVKSANEAYEKSAAANAMEQDQSRYQDLHTITQSAKLRQDRVETQINTHTQQATNIVGSRLHLENVELELSKSALAKAVKTTEATIEEYRARHVPVGGGQRLADAVNELADTQRDTTVQEFRVKAAQGIREENLANSLLRSNTLLQQAGGIDPQGADTALASAVNSVRSAYDKSVTEARQIVRHFNLSSSERQDHALGLKDVTVTKNGVTRTFKAGDTFTREAVIEDQIATGTVGQVQQLVQISGREASHPEGGLSEFRTTISAALAKNGLGSKTLYLGGKTIDDVATGRFKGPEDLMAAAMETIAKGKISQKDLASIDAEASDMLAQALERIQLGNIPAGFDKTKLGKLNPGLLDLAKVAKDTLSGDERVNVKPNSKEHIVKMVRLLEPDFVEPNPPNAPEGIGNNNPSNPQPQ